MVQRLKEVDVVVIGVGMVGSIVAKELAAAGYKVVGLDRGQARFTVPEFQSPAIHDELRFDVRKALMQDNTREPVTFRNQGSQVALPVRRWESFLPGTGLGGSMGHLNGQTYRFQANDFQLASRTREHYAKSVPQTIILPVLLANPKFELRTGCQVQRINLDSTKKHATGVTYIDAVGREFEQPASLVITSTFAINNVRMLLLSGIGTPYDPATGQGVVGRNYAYQTMSTVASFFDEDVIINPFMASGASGTLINDFAGDNFDHSGLGFIGGAFFGAVNTNGRPLQDHPTPPGTPTWGKGWEEAVGQHYNHTVMFNFHGRPVSARPDYCDLDPTYRDAWGQPVL